jgi:hypothetical protein
MNAPSKSVKLSTSVAGGTGFKSHVLFYSEWSSTEADGTTGLWKSPQPLPYQVTTYDHLLYWFTIICNLYNLNNVVKETKSQSIGPLN